MSKKEEAGMGFRSLFSSSKWEVDSRFLCLGLVL
jgi:hypothetical protein